MSTRGILSRRKSSSGWHGGQGPSWSGIKRDYQVTAPAPDSEALAICAMADALYYYETAQNGGAVVSSAIGSVSSTFRDPGQDLSPQAQGRELYRCARLYLDIYRGCGRC